MTERLAIALAQLNPTVGDVAGNVAKLRAARTQAAAAGADLMVSTELVIAGYPPEDLVLKPAFQGAVESAVGKLASETGDGGPGLVVGCPWRHEGKLFNAALVLAEGTVQAVRFKHELPNYGVFDEARVFAPGPLPGPVSYRGVRLGLMICEDMWTPDVTECLQETGAEILVVGNGSPFDVAKSGMRLSLAVARVVESGLPLLYVNQVGGQDELVFEGASFVLNADRSLAAQAPAWREDVVLTQWRRNGAGGWTCAAGRLTAQPERCEAIYQALTTGLRDYVRKNRFPGVVLGLSGGIDSALSAVIAVDALAAGQVRCVMMPSPHTSPASLDDATALAGRLGARLDTIPIGPGMEAFDDMLGEAFSGRHPDLTEENIQARLRAVTLMALSNKFGDMLLTTGNKSEMSVGYTTLYGDLSGGYSVLKDVYKTTVYELARWRNGQRPDGAHGPDQRVIPESILTKAPTAELRPGQTDQDSLPPYDVLDDILECLVERDMSVDEIVGRDHPRATVEGVVNLLYVAEYKRRQAPPGVKITEKSFGRDRRYPITNAFRGIE